MSTPRLMHLWMSFNRLRKEYDKDDFELGYYVIDAKNSMVEIDGSPCLRQLLYEASPEINSKWKNSDKSQPISETEEVQPPGTTCFLPYLPPGSIGAMTERVLRQYWTDVMHRVLPERKRGMGYDTHR